MAVIVADTAIVSSGVTTRRRRRSPTFSRKDGYASRRSPWSNWRSASRRGAGAATPAERETHAAAKIASIRESRWPEARLSF